MAKPRKPNPFARRRRARARARSRADVRGGPRAVRPHGQGRPGHPRHHLPRPRGGGQHARVHLTVISCHTCAVPACCSYMIGAHSCTRAVPRSRPGSAANSATPRAARRSKAAAHAMETTQGSLPAAVRVAGRRRALHGLRQPAEHLWHSPRVLAGVGLRGRGAHRHHPHHRAVEHRRPSPTSSSSSAWRPACSALPVHYRGALPRMVLLALQPRGRRDYVSFLRRARAPAAHRTAWATK